MAEELNVQELAKAYSEGQSLNSIAKAYDTYPTTIRRLFEKNGIKLRHDQAVKGSHNMIKNGDKLLEWARAQGRLVTKAELAKVVGTKRLSPAYFVKYPELGQYVAPYEQKELSGYTKQLYDWLKNNNISYKPNDKTALEGVPVPALLLGEYKNILISVDIRIQAVSKRRHINRMEERVKRAKENGHTIIVLKKDDFKNLDVLKKLLNDAKER